MATVSLSPAFSASATVAGTPAKVTTTSLGTKAFSAASTATVTAAKVTVTPMAAMAFAASSSAAITTNKSANLVLNFGGTSSATVLIPRGYVVDASTGRPQYRCELLDAATGTPVGEVESAALDPINETVNGVGTFGFAMSANDPKASLIRPNLTEVRVWRGGIPEFWGPILRSSSDGMSLRVQAADNKWYFSRRTIGLIPKTNLLVNGDFEQGPTGWNFTYVPGSVPAVPPTWSITNNFLTGSHSLSITGASSTQVVTTGLLSTALFYPNSSTLLPGGEDAVIAVAVTLTAGPIEVVGHTANDGTGSGLALSAARASVVADIIAANSTVRPITSKGVGYYDPDPNYAIDAPEQRRVTISGTATVEAKGNKQFAGQTILYTNPSAFRKMPLTLVGWFKVTDWVAAGIGYGVDLELVDPLGSPDPLTGIFDKNKSTLSAAAKEAVQKLAYSFNTGPIEVIGHAASGETGTAALSLARAAAVAAVITATTSVGPVTYRGAGTAEPIANYAVSGTEQQGCTFTGVVDKVITNATVPMDEYTAHNAWIRQECTIEVPAIVGKQWKVNVRLHPPQGTVLWDSVAVIEGTVLGFYDTDQADIVAGLVAHAQDESLGKSDLRIGSQCPSTGVIRTREYAWADRKPVSEALAEFPTLFDGMDWDVLFGADERWVQTWYPRRGQDTDYVLAYGSNITTWTVDHDGEQTGSTIVVQAASSSGPGREEGTVLDATPLDGIVLEKVWQAPTDSSIGTLDAQAEEGWRRYSKPVLVPRVTCHPGYTTELLNSIGLGDRVRLVLPDVDGTFRITGQTLDPTTDQLSYQLAEE